MELEAEEDYWGDVVLDWYTRFGSAAYKPVLIGLILAAPASIFLFYMFISSSISNILAYVAFVTSLTFIFISLGILGWILE
jgi:hypothetical protein